EVNCPEVLTLCLPNDSTRIRAFLDHIWPFDRSIVTDEDKSRTLLYKQERSRSDARRQSLTLAEFVGGLELEVTIGSPPPNRIGRVAELTRRTNQFNASGKRWSETQVLDAIAEGYQCLAVDAKDRFGDYGLVGVMVFDRCGDALGVNTLLL